MLNKLFKVVKKYSISNELLIINLTKKEDINYFIGKGYNVSILDCDLNSYHINHKFSLVIFNNYLEYMTDKNIEKSLKLIKRNAKEVIFDVPVSNFFCSDDHKDINYKSSKFYKEVFERLDYVLVEEISYRYNLFEKHKIFVICPK